VKITLLTEESLRLEPATGPITIEAPSYDQSYSPFHMVASGLAVCTFSVLQSWASNAEIPVDDLVIEVSWSFAEDPHRLGAIDLTFSWPSLPANRLVVARRVAALCPVHTTFEHPPLVSIRERGAEKAA
jgi:uncharacterized OsmC-like protein